MSKAPANRRPGDARTATVAIRAPVTGFAVRRAYEETEPTCVAALPSVSSIVWMTFWPASKARIEEIMSTIERAGSAPELSSVPERTVPVAAPAAVPVTSESPCLRGS